MTHIEITRREVLNNLIRFKESLLDLRDREEPRPWSRNEVLEKRGERVYQALLNSRTGDMRFAKKIYSLEPHMPVHSKKGGADEWKEISIVVRLDPREKIHFEVFDEKKRNLSSQGLEPLAWRIAKETVEVLNHKGLELSFIPGEWLPEEAVLNDLSMIHIEQGIEDLPCWRNAIGREEAENLLAGHPPGTYLVREASGVPRRIAFEISGNLNVWIHPYLLTYVDSPNKISEFFVLHLDKGWTIYADNPRLLDPYYQYFSSPQALLASLHPKVRHPLIA